VAMSAEHRRRRVSELVQERGSVRVADLADELGVAPVTARRDVAQLAALDLVDHGYGIASWPDQVPPYLPVAVRHLASLGHSRIVLAAHRSPTDAGIRAGYLSALDVSALGEPPVPVIDTFSLRSNPTGFESAVEQLLAAVRGHAVTAALVHNDVDAIMLVHRLRALGVRVPGDLPVVAYDDEVADTADPPLTAVQPPKREIGRTAARMLLGRLDEARRDRAGWSLWRQVDLLPRLRLRDSCVHWVERPGGRA
jgi:hypothetical protein